MLLLVLLAGGVSGASNPSGTENDDTNSLTVVPHEERESDDSSKEEKTALKDDETEEEVEETSRDSADNGEGREEEQNDEEDDTKPDQADESEDRSEDDVEKQDEPDSEESEDDGSKDERDSRDEADEEDKEDQESDKEKNNEEENDDTANKKDDGVSGQGDDEQEDTREEEEKERDTSAPEGKVLVPGNGFAGETPQPDQIGNEDAQAIARWDVVPFQSFSNIFNVGVVAFHKDSIDRVEFSVDGGPWTSVSTMTHNPRTDVKEYWATLDASKFSVDGPVEVRAVVYPNKGVARVLAGDINGAPRGEHGIELVVNKNGTYDPDHYYVSPGGSDESGDGSKNNPYKTVWKASVAAKNDGSRAPVIYLQAGTYDGFRLEGIDSDTWVVVSGAPGTSRNDVIVTNNLKERFTNNHLLVSGIRFQLPDVGILFHAHSAGGRFARHIWMDDLNIVGNERSNSVRWSADVVSTHITNSSLTNNVKGFSGNIVRNTDLHRIGEDSFTNARLLLNSSVEDVDRDKSGVPTAHPDVYQLLGSSKNQIAYGVTATKDIHSQGFFMGGDTDKDIAFVNIELSNRHEEKDKWWPHSLTIESADHLVVKDSWFHGRVFGVTELPVKDIYIENTKLGDTAPYRRGSWDYNEVVIVD